MKFPYYSPNLRVKDVFEALLISKEKAINVITEYYRKMTGKRYILLTNSCRTALYLAWKAIEEKGEVITSPLTCKIAIDPIEESGNKPVFADINKNSLNIDLSDIEHRITDKTIAIQAIHLGGLSCEMDKIKELAKKYNLLIIEDCAQALGATYKGQYTGSFGEIACFSLIKNAYGIGGGVFVTNDESVYLKAKKLNSTYLTQPKILLIYRAIRNIIETKQKKKMGSLLLNMLKRVKGKKKTYTSVKEQLKRVSALELKIAAFQHIQLRDMHKKRRSIGEYYSIILSDKGLLVNNNNHKRESSYTKYYVYHPSIKYESITKKLAKMGIETMHLEQRNDRPLQKRIVSKEMSIKNGLLNYHKVHDSLISLPITENMTDKDALFIIKTFDSLLSQK